MDLTGGQDAILSDHVLVDGTPASLTFYADGNLRWSENGRARCLVLEKEVLGVSAQGSTIVLKCAVESSSRFLCFDNSATLVRKMIVVEPSSEDSMGDLYQKLREYLRNLSDRPKRLFVLVNPFGGKKSGSIIFADNVKPLLEDAQIQYTVMETKRQLHAKEVAQELDLTIYDGIVCVSGDGILVEVINGLLQREDWNTAIKMPIGVVPAGTGNGMAKSLLDSVGEPCSVINAVLAIIRGHKQSLDVTTILQGGTRFFSVLMLAWGLVADIDIESEKYRFLGSARIDIYAIQRIFCLRKYLGRIHFVPATGYELQVENLSQKVEAVDAIQFRNPNELAEKTQKFAYLGTDVSAEYMEWRTIEGPFISIWIHNVPWGSEDAMPAPDAKFSDGFLDLVLIRDCPKMALLSLMTEVSKGNHIKDPHVLYIKVKAFILEPGQRTTDKSKGGIIDSDGEVLARGNGTYMCEMDSLMAYDKIQLTVDQGLATLFAPV
ncbi:hypothetical protein V2J09_019564 [Rumex salicifolius]